MAESPTPERRPLTHSQAAPLDVQDALRSFDDRLRLRLATARGQLTTDEGPLTPRAGRRATTPTPRSRGSAAHSDSGAGGGHGDPVRARDTPRREFQERTAPATHMEHNGYAQDHDDDLDGDGGKGAFRSPGSPSLAASRADTAWEEALTRLQEQLLAERAWRERLQRKERELREALQRHVAIAEAEAALKVRSSVRSATPAVLQYSCSRACLGAHTQCARAHAGGR